VFYRGNYYAGNHEPSKSPERQGRDKDLTLNFHEAEKKRNTN
jgi:hypothetical protein